MIKENLFEGYEFDCQEKNKSYLGEPTLGEFEQTQDVPSYAPEWRNHIDNFGIKYTERIKKCLASKKKKSKTQSKM